MRTVDPGIQSDLDTGCTTLTWLARLRSQTGEVKGLTLLDRRVSFDDGDGVVVYQPDPGYDPTEMESASDMSVDGGTFASLLQSAGVLSEADVRSGAWDNAEIRIYRVNYLIPTAGRMYELKRGNLGRLVMKQGLGLNSELRGTTQPLRQVLVWLDSILCRAPFGSGESEEREYCGKAVGPLLVSFTVTGVGAEADRVFTASGLGQANGYFVPGVVLWDTGANAGNTVRGIDSFNTGGVVGLRKGLPYPIQSGDTGRIRIDCDHTVEGPRGCRFHFAGDWVNHYRGEPYIPQGESPQIPGADVGPGNGGSTSVPESTEIA